MKNLYTALSKCSSEEEVKYEFAKFFKFKLDTKERIDLYTESILFEFKYDVNMRNVHSRAKVIAQALYYIGRLTYGNDPRVPSRWICGIDKNEAILIKTDDLKDYYLKSKRRDKYDWDLRPSNPDTRLVDDLSNDEKIINLYVYDFANDESREEFVNKIRYYQTGEQISLFENKKEINEYNFYPIYLRWKELFGSHVENGRKSSEYFITDIEHGRTVVIEQTKLLFTMNSGEIIPKFVPINDYEHFWNAYEHVADKRVVSAIRQKMDRMSEIEQRRFTGEFFTPLPFAEKALDYIYRVVKKDFWSSGKYRLWDMAAGTGNLEYVLPAEALKYCYISTLLEDDADYCRKIFPDATVFQYDYLNDDVSFIKHPEIRKMGVKCKMPEKLVEDLNNPELTWIIFINPPYATSNNNERDKDSIDKTSVSMTAIQEIMSDKELGETSRELASQFLYRINEDFSDKKAYLAMFSKLKYINSINDQRLRDDFFKYRFEKGFVFSSKNFDGCKSAFPIGFVIWNIHEKKELGDQDVTLDVYDNNVEKIGTKRIITIDSNEELLSKWIKRKRNKGGVMPPFSSAIKLADKRKDVRDKVAVGFLASFMCKSNDYANQNNTSFLSAPYCSAGALSVTAENFEKAIIISVVRRLPKANWLNDRDQMFKPWVDVLSNETFVSDCVVWALFSSYNDTVSMDCVEYKGNKYRIKNEFYPFLLEVIQQWDIEPSAVSADVFARHENRFVANWISKHTLSQESNEVYSAAERFYRCFYKNINQIPWPKYQIKKWDAGWWQIRMSMSESGIGQEEFRVLKERHKILGDKILPRLYEYGFIRSDMDIVE